MDHLPRPLHPTYDPPELPCYTEEPYDGKGFESYPERQGWGTKTVEEWHQIFCHPPDTFLAFLQRWLYFGALERVLEQRASIQDFTRVGSKPPYRILATDKLLEIRKTFIPLIQTIPAIRIDLINIQTTHARLLSGRPISSSRSPDTQVSLSLFIQSNHFKDPRSDLFKLSISLVLDVLEVFLDEIQAYQLEKGHLSGGQLASSREIYDLVLDTPATGTRLCQPALEEDQLYQKLRNNGWCPSRLGFLFARLDVPALLFLSQVEAPPSPRRHETLANQPYTQTASVSQHVPSANSDRCSPYRCAVLKVDEKTYKTKHIDGCPGCFEVAADPGELLKILRTDSIPLIRAIDKNYHDTDVKLMPSTSHTKYTAISHVWSDGLGNVQKTALPRCQLLHLSNIVEETQFCSDYGITGPPRREVLFWLDTICCPPDAARQDEAQELAINKMVSTYRDASEILVLDAWLSSTKIQKMMPLEINLRILCCNWNSRLWTLQEAAIAKSHRFFQFADSVYDYDRQAVSASPVFDWDAQTVSAPLVPKTPSVEEADAWHLALNRSILRMQRDLFEFSDPNITLANKILYATNALQFRSTSVASDEPLCLSALLGLNRSARRLITGARPDMRMTHLWSRVDTVPSAFLFGDWPRIHKDGLRWAPQSLLSGPQNAHFMTYEPGFPPSPPRVTKDGLECQRQGLVFHIGKYLLGHNFDIVDEMNTVYNVALALQGVHGAIPYTNAMYSLRPDAPQPSQYFDVYQLFQSEELAFFECEHVERIRRTGNVMVVDNVLRPFRTGFIAIVIKKSKEKIVVRRLFFATLARRTKAEVDNLPAEISADSLTRLLSFTRAQTLPDSQMWCID